MGIIDKLIEFYRLLGWKVYCKASPERMNIWAGEVTIKLLSDDLIELKATMPDRRREVISGEIENVKKAGKKPLALFAFHNEQKEIEWTPLQEA